MLKMDLQLFGGRSSAGGNAKASATKAAEPKATEANYHVNRRDYAGGEYIDKGTVEGRKIGSSVKLDYGGETRSGKIIGAHKYPNGRVEFTVEMKATKTARAVTKTVSDKRFKK